MSDSGLPLIDETYCLALDQKDPLAEHRRQFRLPTDTIYLDGNSLGALPRASEALIGSAIRKSWGQDLIRSWNTAGWFELPLTLGDRIGELVGAAQGQVVVSDNTSINTFKAVSTAVQMGAGRHRIIACRDEFPTDLYMIQGLSELTNGRVQLDLADSAEDALSRLGPDTAAVLLSQVNYRSAALLDMAGMTRDIQAAGAMAIWDLCHSAGALPIDLDGCGVDIAVGCTYKYLNGGPGSPAFIYVAKRHQGIAKQPLSGWWGHAHPFGFSASFDPAPDIRRFQTGTQPILSLIGVQAGLDTFHGVSMDEIRAKSVGLCELFANLVRQECGSPDVEVLAAAPWENRGSHVCVAFPRGYALVQALIDRGVIGDFRAPDLMRFGFAPLYNGHHDVWRAVGIMNQCLQDRSYLDPGYNRVAPVT